MNTLFYLLLLFSFFQVPTLYCMEMEGPPSKKEESLEEMQFVGPFAPFEDKTAELIELLKKNASLEEFMPLFDEGFIREPQHIIETQFGPVQANGLMAAILFNRPDVFEKVLENLGPFIDLKNDKGQTALMLAVAIGNKDIINKLLSHGASIGTADATGKLLTQYSDNQIIVTLIESYKNPLTQAVEKNDIPGVKKITTFNPYLVNQIDIAGKTPFDYAIDKDPINLAVPMLWNLKNPRSLEIALVKMIDANNAIIVDRLLRIANDHYPQLYFLSLTQRNTTALIYAIKQKKPAIAAKIIEEFLRQLATEYKKLTIQYEAKDIKQIVHRKLKAFLNYQDTAGKTALMYTIEKKMLPLIELLLGTNAVLLNPRDNTGATALIYAVKTADPVILSTIFKSGVFQIIPSVILIQNNEGKLPLMYAIELKYPIIIDMLLDVYKTKNYGFGLRDVHGKNVLLYAIIYDNLALARALLLLQPALINIDDIEHKAPLMYAIEKDNPQFIQLILSYFPNIEVQDVRGFSALDYVSAMLNNNYPHAREIAGLVGDYARRARQKPEIPGRPIKQRRIR